MIDPAAIPRIDGNMAELARYAGSIGNCGVAIGRSLMYDVSAESWLTQDMRDHLDDGPLGLYQFIWALNGSCYDLPEHDAIDLSRRIALRFLREGLAELYLVTWPGFHIVEGPLGSDALEAPEAWNIGEAGPFLALIPKDLD